MILPLLVAAFVAASSRGAQPGPIVLIVVDTLRADHTSLYGYHRDTTPALARLAEDAAVVDNALSAAAWTLPSVTSMLSGQWPSVHGAGFGGGNGFRRATTALPTLAEILRDNGYRTGAVANAGYLHPEFGLARGFQSYDFAAGTDEEIRRADESVDRALDWVDDGGAEPFFLFFHVFDVHRHYDAPEPVRGTFTDQFADRYGASLASLQSRLDAEATGDLDLVVAAYDEEVLFVDGQIARLIEGLQQRAVWDDSLVILTSDHGEAFFEHGARGHGSAVFNEVVRVPFVVWGPEVARGRVRGPVSTVDILPTALEFAGIDAPPMAGLPLGGHLAGEPLPERVLFAENAFYDTNLTAAVRWPLKAIRDFASQSTSLFNLSRDPGETQDLMPTASRPLRRKARDLVRQARDLRQVGAGEDVALDDETLDRLRALGYIQ